MGWRDIQSPTMLDRPRSYCSYTYYLGGRILYWGPLDPSFENPMAIHLTMSIVLRLSYAPQANILQHSLLQPAQVQSSRPLSGLRGGGLPF